MAAKKERQTTRNTQKDHKEIQMTYRLKMTKDQKTSRDELMTETQKDHKDVPRSQKEIQDYSKQLQSDLQWQQWCKINHKDTEWTHNDQTDKRLFIRMHLKELQNM